jgi:hypothetical protein
MSLQGEFGRGIRPADAPAAAGSTSCPNCECGGARPPPSYVYAIGRIEPRFPSLSVEKEFAQSAGRAQTASLTDRQVIHTILARRENRYLLRELCWVMTVEGVETYLLTPRDPLELDLLMETLRATSDPTGVDVVIGELGPIAPATYCNGLTIPFVAYDQIYSFNRASLIDALPRPENVEPDRFRASAAEVFDRITQIADNAGATDAHRALNYLAMRYPGIYAAVLDAHARNMALGGVQVRPSTLGGARKILDVVFSFTNRATDVAEKQFLRVDVTEKFPFLFSKISPYVEH